MEDKADVGRSHPRPVPSRGRPASGETIPSTPPTTPGGTLFPSPSRPKSDFIRAAVYDDDDELMGTVDTDTEDDLMRHVSSPARVYRDLVVSSETDDALCFDATAPKLGAGAGDGGDGVVKPVAMPDVSSLIESRGDLAGIEDDEAETSHQSSYRFKLTELTAVKDAVSEWKVGHKLDGRARRGSVGQVNQVGSVPEIPVPKTQQTPIEEALDFCQTVGYYRIYHDDPDLMDDDGESDIAKALMMALKTRQRYQERSCQAVPTDRMEMSQERSRKHSEREHIGGHSHSSNSSGTVSPHSGEQVSNSVFGESFLGGGPAASRTSSRTAAKPASRASSRSSSAVFPPQAIMESFLGCYSPSCRSGMPGATCYSPSCPQNQVSWKMRNGVFEVHDDKPRRQGLFSYIEFAAWQRDNNALLSLLVDGATKSFAYNRMGYLRKRFQMHRMLNETDEIAAQKTVPHRDFYNQRKVDTHVHLSACMNAKHLLRFIKKKMKIEKDVPVLCRDGKVMTLSEVFENLGLTTYDLNVDMLDVHADRSMFHRFDRFNKKYNPVGESALREIFLKSNNYIGGRYYAEVIKEVIADLEESKYQMAEYRISIYGKGPTEWADLAGWFHRFDMHSPNVRWLIQTPRIFNIYAKAGLVKTFAEMLDNVFRPLFEATANPADHPKLAHLLENIVGFDSVDDESKPEAHAKKNMARPEDWTSDKNPPYSYYIYYFYANMSVLNQYRKSRGMNTFKLRPHCGEAGSIDHLVAAFLSAEGIAHGIMLRKTPVLQYLYYLAGIPIYMSPLSNNSLFLDISKNPFHDYFETGMFISLSTDDPLQFHMSKEPLIEEYAIARQVWKLSTTDMAELCSNSVRMSGFTNESKMKWLGEDYEKPGPLGNSIEHTNVPDARAAFRFETMMREIYILDELTRARNTTDV